MLLGYICHIPHYSVILLPLHSPALHLSPLNSPLPTPELPFYACYNGLIFQGKSLPGKNLHGRHNIQYIATVCVAE
jgi:hypothetical protein